MKDIVVIPCHKRPELLHHVLDRIQGAYGSEKLHYHFCFDYGYSTDNNIVVEQMMNYSHTIVRRERSHFSAAQQSINVLEGLREAVNMGAKTIYLIEDDILIASDFFQFHQKLHKLHPNLFCSIAVKNINTNYNVSQHTNHYYLSSNDYASQGVCFQSSVLQELVIPHACLNYFSNMKGYCSQNFQNALIGTAFAEQDGLIRRIQHQSARPIAFPHVPRAYHCGFYGYHRRPNPFIGSLESRIQQARSIVYSESQMKSNSVKGLEHDSIPVGLEHPPLNKKLVKNQPSSW